MSLEICVLASGSSGNCTVVRSANGVFLIDAGIGPRITRDRMKGTGVNPEQIRAICLTHLDSDHFRPSWVRFVAQRQVRIFCHLHRVDELRQRVRSFCSGQPDAPAEAFCALVTGFAARPFQPIDGVNARPLAFDHDVTGSHGFVIDCDGTRLGYATDLGNVPDRLIERFRDLDILALESNYDPGMQLASARPWFLKQRIMGGSGHLSNAQAFHAIQRIFDKAEENEGRLPSHVVLLHRSRQCNCPKLMQKVFARDRRIAQRLTLAEQYRRSNWLRAAKGKLHVGEQMMLAWRT